MQVNLNGNTYELIPFDLVNDISKSGTATAGVGGNGGFTDWNSTGNVLDLRFIYGDVYADHGGSDYTSDWEDMFTWSGVREGGEVVEYTAQSRIVSDRNNPQQLTWQFRSDSNNTNPNFWANFTVNYDGTGYDWTSQILLYTQTNINAELCVDNNDVPMFQPGYMYNGLREVGLTYNSYSQNDVYQYDGEWYDTRTDQHNIYQEYAMPNKAHNLVGNSFKGPHYLHSNGASLWMLFAKEMVHIKIQAHV